MSHRAEWVNMNGDIFCPRPGRISHEVVSVHHLMPLESEFRRVKVDDGCAGALRVERANNQHGVIAVGFRECDDFRVVDRMPHNVTQRLKRRVITAKFVETSDVRRQSATFGFSG